MKTNISLALNALLILAVGYLFIQSGKGKKAATDETPVNETAVETPKVVYINADTLLEKYDYFKRQKEALQAREVEATQSLGGRSRALENEFLAVQKKVQQGLLAPNQIMEEEQRLSKKQQQLLAEQENVTQELMLETQRINAELQDSLIVVLDKIKLENGYEYILQYGQGSSVLSAKDDLDITESVLTELNKSTAPK
ncbi:MAG TPA: OmpH family outer membrane protein [Saprospiraceae bacterium]|nr:OmpH family outer membrane protein [Saprospiraceae bacterium]HMQ81891.1 OmpH family outer membrane protein [Saprospiraceae bacterium]